MKKLKVSLLALSFVAGGIAAASAASDVVYRSYQFSINTTNTGNVWEVDGNQGVARPVSGFPSVQQNAGVFTDTSGKIIGSGFIRLDFNTNNTFYSGYSVDVTGKMSTKNNKASVQQKAKGPGGQVNGDGTSETGSIQMDFTGEPGINPNNTNFLALVGKLKGTIKGKTQLGDKSAKFENVTAFIPDSYFFNPINGTVGVQQTDKKQIYFTDAATGKGTIKNNTYKGSLKGIGWSKGSKVNINGNLGLYTNAIGTNIVTFVAPITVEAKGKTHGQTFESTAARALNQINAGLVY